MDFLKQLIGVNSNSDSESDSNIPITPTVTEFTIPTTTIQGKPINPDGSEPIRVFKYASDIHLEMRSSLGVLQDLKHLYEFEKKANHKYYLALIGDIGSPYHKAENLIQFLKRCSDQFEEVFFVMGNHEYYNQGKYTMSQVHQGLKDICNLYSNVHLLENETFILDEYKIIGTTLWSDVDSKSEAMVNRCLNDYNLIKTDLNSSVNNGNNNIDTTKINQASEVRKINVKDTNLLHKKAMEFLKKEVYTDNPNNQPCIVLTHHAPQFNDHTHKTYTSHPKFKRDDDIGQAFSTDLSSFISKPIIVWLYGHTHFSTDYQYNNVRILANQHGYNSGEDLNECKFNPHCYFVL